MAFEKCPPSIWEQSDENRRLTRSSSETVFFGGLLCTPAFPLAFVAVVLLILLVGGGISQTTMLEPYRGYPDH